jgi:hypothetical protein
VDTCKTKGYRVIHSSSSGCDQNDPSTASSFAEELKDQFIFHQLDVNKINTRVDKNNVQMMSYFNAEKFKPSKTVINLERSI